MFFFRFSFLYTALCGVAHYPLRKRGDYRSRKDRVEQRTNAWLPQLPSLVTAFLELKRGGARTSNLAGATTWAIETIDIQCESPTIPFLAV